MTDYSLNAGLSHILREPGDHANLGVVCLGLAYWSDGDLRAVGTECVVVEYPRLQPLSMNEVFRNYKDRLPREFIPHTWICYSLKIVKHRVRDHSPKVELREP